MLADHQPRADAGPALLLKNLTVPWHVARFMEASAATARQWGVLRVRGAIVGSATGTLARLPFPNLREHHGSAAAVPSRRQPHRWTRPWNRAPEHGQFEPIVAKH